MWPTRWRVRAQPESTQPHSHGLPVSHELVLKQIQVIHKAWVVSNPLTARVDNGCMARAYAHAEVSIQAVQVFGCSCRYLIVLLCIQQEVRSAVHIQARDGLCLCTACKPTLHASSKQNNKYTLCPLACFILQKHLVQSTPACSTR